MEKRIVEWARKELNQDLSERDVRRLVLFSPRIPANLDHICRHPNSLLQGKNGVHMRKMLDVLTAHVVSKE